MGLRDWSGWSRLDDLDRRTGLSGDARGGRWLGVVLSVLLPIAWFIKGLTIGDSPLRSLVTVLAIVGVIALGTLGGYAVQRWLRSELGDRAE